VDGQSLRRARRSSPPLQPIQLRYHEAPDGDPFDGVNLGAFSQIDYYPGKGLFFNAWTLVEADPYTGSGLGLNVKMGNAVPTAGGFWVTFATPKPEKMVNAANPAIARVDFSGKVLERRWLVESDAWIPSAYLGKFEGGLLAGWNEWIDNNPETVEKRFLQRLSADGKVLGAPEGIPYRIDPQQRFFTDRNGDVGWLHTYEEGITKVGTITVVKVKSCK
jgi:hypothetical protein